MDSESKNRAAETEFEQDKANEVADPMVKHMSDVHVCKRVAQHFSNWFLIVEGYRINRVLLRTLGIDPQLKALLRPCLTIAACRNRDRMDTNSLVEISSVRVRKVLTDLAGTITESIIPEKYRVYEGNKVGTIKAPSAMCTGPPS